MKLHLTQADGENLITAYSEQSISVNHQRFEHSLIVAPTQLISDWKTSAFKQLQESDFEKIASLNPEVVLLLAMDKKQIVGYLLAEIMTLEDGRKVLFISYLYVAPTMRNKGLGKTLTI